MERSELRVESPPAPPRKVRHTAVTMREKGLPVACRNGRFVMPREAYKNSAMVVGICELTVNFYNMTADLKMMKAAVESHMEEAEGDALCSLQRICTRINKYIRGLRSLGHQYRAHVLNAECAKPVNEPTDWARD